MSDNEDSALTRTQKGNEVKLLFMMVLSFSYFIVEIVVGYMTNSMALVADSFHMLSDVIALVIAYVSVKMSGRKWSTNTFGSARAEVLGALINAVFLFALCFTIVVESIQRFAEPAGIKSPIFVLAVGGFGLLVNVIGLFMFYNSGDHHGHSHGGHSHVKKTKKTEQKEDNQTHSKKTDPMDAQWSPVTSEVPSTEVTVTCNDLHDNHHHHEATSASQMNIHGVFLHVLADALGSVVVVVSALIIWLVDWEYENYIDPTLSILLVILICFSTWPLFTESSRILLQNVPGGMSVQNLELKILKEVEKPIMIHNLHVWQLTGNEIIASIHVIHDGDIESTPLLQKITDILTREGIHSITVQLERSSEDGRRNEFMKNVCMVQEAKNVSRHVNGNSVAEPLAEGSRGEVRCKADDIA